MVEWYFRDKVGKVQGPFSNEEMRAWYEAGWLAADLAVARGDPRNNGFKSLASHFPNGGSAFLDDGDSQGGEGGGQWYFLDKSHKQQGPFTDIHMRQWHMAGYFEPTLMIIDVSVPDPTWQPLRSFFPNIADAFVVPNAFSVPYESDAVSAVPAQQKNKGGADPRFEFGDWLPPPPRYRGVKKVYPSEKNGGKRRVAVRDVDGQMVQTFSHLK